MTTATPELKIEPQLPVLAFNFGQLRAWATGLTERYTNMVVTEDAIVEVKKDMADLNKNKAKLEEARKEVVRRVSEPIRSFEAQVKEVVGIFDAAYAGLAGQVKAFEDAQREEKRKRVIELVNECFVERFGNNDAEWPESNVHILEKWLNKTTSLKSIREEIEATIQRQVEEEERRKALAQAQKDRAIAIENHVRALNEKHGLNVPVANFMGSVGPVYSARPLNESLEGITAIFTAEAAKKARQEQEKAAAACQAVEQQPALVEQPAPKTEQQAFSSPIRAMSIVLEYDTINEARVKACLETLKSLCVTFGARYR